MNPTSRDYARQLGLRLHLGDASQEEILMHAGLAEVCLVVVTVPDPHDAVQIVAHLIDESGTLMACRLSEQIPE